MGSGIRERDDRRCNLSLFLIGAVSVLGWMLGGPQMASAQSTVKDLEPALKMSPVPLSVQGKDRDSVARGSYLVNAVADCGGCHTFPQFLRGGDPFQGTAQSAIAPVRNIKHFLAGGFCVGKVISSNITPGLDTGMPANMTLKQFITAMRSGRGKSANLLHVMPWPTYHNMSDEDVTAIYQYLSSVPHAESCNTTCPPSYLNSADCPNPAPPR